LLIGCQSTPKTYSGCTYLKQSSIKFNIGLVSERYVHAVWCCEESEEREVTFIFLKYFMIRGGGQDVKIAK
jgi:hypothetical protein